MGGKPDPTYVITSAQATRKGRTVMGVLVLVLTLAGFPALFSEGRTGERTDGQERNPSENARSSLPGQFRWPKGLRGLTPIADGHILVMDKGAVVCRSLSEEDARVAAWEELTVPLRPVLPFRLSQQQTGLKIILRATQQLEGFPQAKDALLRAAATWESLIRTPITIIIDVDFGPTRFGQAFPSNALGVTSQTFLSGPYADVRQRLLSGATGMAERSLYEMLPQSSVPTDIGTTSTTGATHSQLRALGVIRPVADPNAESNEIGPPPRIGFNSNFSFDFDPSDGIDSGKTDFDAVAVHEIGHALGFISRTGARELDPGVSIQLSVWDFYRFRPGVTKETFPTANRILSSGGDQVFFVGGREIPLSTGRPDGTGGDRQQASHWKDDSQIGQFIGIMDPVIPAGRREIITLNDLTALDFFGYRLKGAVPSPMPEATIDLPSEGSQSGMIEAPRSAPDGILAPTQFRLRVPEGATAIAIALQASGTQDLDLYVRFGQRVALDGGRPVADYSAEYPQGNESLEISSTSFPALQPGEYFIAVANFGPDAAAFTISVTVRTDTVVLTSGAPASGSIPAPPPGSGVLGRIQYRIAVPERASQLKVELATMGRADTDLFVRFGQRVTIESGRVIADYRAETSSGNEALTITPLSSPPLRTGDYFIAVGNFGPGPADFTVTATVTVLPPNTPDIEVRPTTLDFGATPVGGRRERVLTVQNLGDGSLVISNVTISDARFSLQSPTGSFTLDPKTEQAVIVRFSPAASGLQTATLTFTTNDPDEATVSVSLRGQGSTSDTEELSTDDGTVESGALRDGAIVVNRLTPSKYPATLRTVRIFFARGSGLPSPSGTQIKLILFADPSEAGRPPANPTVLVDPITVTIPTIPASGRFVDFTLSGIPPITSGDIYVGFQAPTPAGGVVFWADVDGPQQGRAFLSTDNGASYGRAFFVDRQGNRTPINFPIRAVVSFASGMGGSEQLVEDMGASDFGIVTESPADSWTPAVVVRGDAETYKPLLALDSDGRNRVGNRRQIKSPVGGNGVHAGGGDGGSGAGELSAKERGSPGQENDGETLSASPMLAQPPPRVLAVPDVRAEQGQKVTVAISLSEGRGVSAMRLTVRYNPTVLSLVETDAITPGTLVPEGFSLTATSPTPGEVAIVITPPVTQPIPSFRSGSGSIVHLPFQAAADSPMGATSAMVVSKLSAADAASGAVSIVAQNGTLSVGPPVRVISLPSVEGVQGATVSVPIYLSEGSSISALQTIVRYDPDLLAPVPNNPVALGTLVPPRFSLVTNTTVRGQVTLVIAPPISSPLPTFFSGGGTVATISFRVASEAREGAVSDLSLTSSASDSQGNAVILGAQNGVFTVLSVRRGDVNRDGTINSQDLVRLILHLSGQQPLTGQALTSADMDDDGQITPQDLVLLIRLLAGIQ